MALTEYRLVVRNQADTADLLDVSTRRGGTNPYLVGPPSGDGTEFDPISGRGRAGAFTGVVIDPITSGTSRLVTSLLEDTDGRPQMAALKATWYSATDGGAWTALMPGVVSGVRTSGGAFEITVADVVLAERKATAFAPKQNETITAYLARWPIRGCLVGGPVRSSDGSGFLHFKDLGGWECTVDSATLIGSGTKSLYLKFNAGYCAPTFQRKTDSWGLGVPSNEAAGAGDRTRATEFDSTPSGGYVYPDDTKRGPWPGIVAEVRTTSATFYAGAQVAVQAKYEDVTRLVQDTGERRGLYVGGLTHADIAAGTKVRVRYFDILPSERSPLYWTGHPVDLLAALWSEAGFAYSASAIETVRAALGSNLRLSVAVTQTEDLAAFLERTIYGPFQIGVRANTSGQLEPFNASIARGSVPTRTIDDDDVPCDESGAPQGTAYDLDIGQAITRVTFEYQPITWDKNDPPMPDGISRETRTIERDSDDPYRVGQKEQSFNLPGYIHRAGAKWGTPTMPQWVDALAHELFDRFGRGALTTEIPLLGGASGDGVVLGEEIYDARPQTPNANKRQGDDVSVSARIGQVVRVTPTETGPAVKVLDSGFWGQAPATLPTLSLAASSTDPKTLAELTIPNAATLTLAGYHVRVQMAVSALTPASTDYADVLYYRSSQIPTGAVMLPAVAPGSKVWIRARSEATGGRPSNWQTAVSVNLTGLAAVTGLSVAGVSGDGSRATATWTLGESDAEVDVYLRLGTGENVRHAPLQAGSTRYTFEGLTPGAAYTAGVEHRHTATGDTSTRVESAFTAGATTATLDAPTDATGFSGSDGSYGIAVIATEVPGFVSVEEAVETGVGTGVYGAFASVGTPVASVVGGWTTWQSTAPNDGKRRQLKARHTGDGLTSSGYTSTVTVTPWTTVALPDYVQVTGQFGPSLTVTPTPGATTYSIAYTGSGGTVELSIDGAAYGTAPASPISVARPSAGSASKSYAFRITADGQTIANEVTVPAIDKDTVTPDLTLTPGAMDSTTAGYIVTASNPSGGAAPTITATFIDCSGTMAGVAVAANTPTVVADGVALIVTRPAWGVSTQATLRVVASLSGGGAETIQRTVQNQVKTTFGPTLNVVATPASGSYSIDYGYSGTIELRINGGAASTPPSAPFSVTRPAAGGTPLEYAFRCVADGQEVSNIVTIQPVDQDTVTPDLTVTPSAPTATTQDFAVTATNPQGGSAPGVYITVRGTTGTAGGGAYSYADGTEYPFPADGSLTLTVARPAFGTTAQASVTFRAVLTGGGSEIIQRTIQNQVKTTFGPTLEVTVTPGASTYSIAYMGTGTVDLSIDGGAYSAAPASPISVTRTSSDKTYMLKATADGQTITETVTIPSTASNYGPTRFVRTVEVTGQQPTTDIITVAFATADNIQTGDTYSLYWRWETGATGTVDGITSSPCNHQKTGTGGHGLDLSGAGSVGVMEYTVLVKNSSSVLVGQSPTISENINYI